MRVYIQSRSDPLPLLKASEIFDPDFIADDFHDTSNSQFVNFRGTWYNVTNPDVVWWIDGEAYYGYYETFTKAIAFCPHDNKGTIVVVSLIVQIDLDMWNRQYPPGTHVVACIGANEWVCATVESPAYINDRGTPTVKLVRLNQPVALSKLYLARNQRIWPSTALRSSDASTSRRKPPTAPSRVPSTV